MAMTPEKRRLLALDDLAEYLEEQAKRYTNGTIAPVYKAMAEEIREAMKYDRRVNL
jgi:hypothetical protein